MTVRVVKFILERTSLSCLCWENPFFGISQSTVILSTKNLQDNRNNKIVCYKRSASVFFHVFTSFEASWRQARHPVSQRSYSCRWWKSDIHSCRWNSKSSPLRYHEAQVPEFLYVLLSILPTGIFQYIILECLFLLKEIHIKDLRIDAQCHWKCCLIWNCLFRSIKLTLYSIPGH